MAERPLACPGLRSRNHGSSIFCFSEDPVTSIPAILPTDSTKAQPHRRSVQRNIFKRIRFGPTGSLIEAATTTFSFPDLSGTDSVSHRYFGLMLDILLPVLRATMCNMPLMVCSWILKTSFAETGSAAIIGFVPGIVTYLGSSSSLGQKRMA